VVAIVTRAIACRQGCAAGKNFDQPDAPQQAGMPAAMSFILAHIPFCDFLPVISNHFGRLHCRTNSAIDFCSSIGGWQLPDYSWTGHFKKVGKVHPKTPRFRD
jgi:hypothetical protein